MYEGALDQVLVQLGRCPEPIDITALILLVIVFLQVLGDLPFRDQAKLFARCEVSAFEPCRCTPRGGSCARYAERIASRSLIPFQSPRRQLTSAQQQYQ